MQQLFKTFKRPETFQYKRPSYGLDYSPNLPVPVSFDTPPNTLYRIPMRVYFFVFEDIKTELPQDLW